MRLENRECVRRESYIACGGAREGAGGRALCGDSAVVGWVRGATTFVECVDEDVCARLCGFRAF